MRNPELLCNLFLTKDSLVQSMKQVFGVQSSHLSKRFYYFLSRGYDMQRIFVTDFLIRLNCLAEGNFIERNYFAFHILDGDRDGIIGSTDLQNI